MKVRKPTVEEIDIAGNWEFWSKEPSKFAWYYDEAETCYILDGKAEVIAESGDKIQFSKGDWVEFEKGLRCTWEITEEIQKKYLFG